MLKNGGGVYRTSMHVVLGQEKIFQTLPLNEQGRHAGDGKDGCGNKCSIGVVACVSDKESYEGTVLHLAETVVYLCNSLNISTGKCSASQALDRQELPALFTAGME
jgi:N-acetylmuramoyl-L-alanine amidase CwlA